MVSIIWYLYFWCPKRAIPVLARVALDEFVDTFYIFLFSTIAPWGRSQGLLIYMDSQSVANLRASAPSGSVVFENASSALRIGASKKRCYVECSFARCSPKCASFLAIPQTRCASESTKKCWWSRNNCKLQHFEALLDSCLPRARSLVRSYLICIVLERHCKTHYMFRARFAAISTRRGKKGAQYQLPLGCGVAFTERPALTAWLWWFDSTLVRVPFDHGCRTKWMPYFCAFVACLCFPPLFSYLFAPRFFCPSFFFAPRKKPRLVTLKG